MSENNKYRDMFVQEALEHVENLNQSLLKFEEEPNNRELVNVLFRSAHTVKGMAAAMRYDQIRDICKTIEEIFDKFRKDEETMTLDLASVLFEGIDLLRQMIEDEEKKIDLDDYLNHVKNPSSFKKNTVETNTNVSINSHTIRVKMKDLDTLVNLVGETMVCKMQLEETFYTSSDDSRKNLLNLGRLITDLQYQTMKIRMVPINQIFNGFSRMVRDVSVSLGKEIKLDFHDSGIELDRTVLDAITDPLLHILRNSVDHGIETPEKRLMMGKPANGTIRLSSMRVGDRVEIIIEDDGKGIDIGTIKTISLEKGIITEEDATQMTDEQVIALLGTPGLSSVRTITDISGRGVGMNVVMTQVKNVGGKVEIRTVKGMGTKITLIIPLSLAIIGGLLVTIANQKYVLPLSSIASTMIVPKNEIQNVHGKEMLMLGDKLIPLIRVAILLGEISIFDDKSEKIAVVIIDKGGKSYGLVVDSLEKEQEIVIKRLDPIWQGESKFADATILSDGKVALILEPALLV